MLRLGQEGGEATSFASFFVGSAAIAAEYLSHLGGSSGDKPCFEAPCQVPRTDLIGRTCDSSSVPKASWQIRESVDALTWSRMPCETSSCLS